MKLKYYLKGFGIGIIFATLVLSISFYVRKNENKNISRQEVERLAAAYGMVYPEENTEGEIRQDRSGESVLMKENEADKETDNETDRERDNETDKETNNETETTLEAGTVRISEADEGTETVEESETGRGTETDRETENGRETETVQEAEPATEAVSEAAEDITDVVPEPTTEDVTTAVSEDLSIERRTITIVSGMDASAVARLLEASGIIENAEEFNRYLMESGYTKRIRTGVYTFAVGTDYETIAEEFTKVPKWD